MKTRVITIKVAPVMRQPEIVQGVRDETSARAWGERNGYAEVYFLKRRERAYAEKMQVRVDEQAKAIEMKSHQLVMFSQDTLRYAESEP